MLNILFPRACNNLALRYAFPFILSHIFLWRKIVLRRYVNHITMVRAAHLFLRTEISCLEVDICDPNASCQQDDPLAKCVCNPGYEGDGTTCSPIGASVILTFFFINFYFSVNIRARRAIRIYAAQANADAIPCLDLSIATIFSLRIHIAFFASAALPYKSRKARSWSGHDRGSSRFALQ